jgi:hypothetical protein
MRFASLTTSYVSYNQAGRMMRNRATAREKFRFLRQPPRFLLLSKGLAPRVPFPFHAAMIKDAKIVISFPLPFPHSLPFCFSLFQGDRLLPTLLQVGFPRLSSLCWTFFLWACVPCVFDRFREVISGLQSNSLVHPSPLLRNPARDSEKSEQ